MTYIVDPNPLGSASFDASNNLRVTLESATYDANANLRVTLGDSPAADAFGRLRVSNPYTEFDGSFEYDTQTVRWLQSATGSASVSHNANRASVMMKLGTLPGALIRRKTRTRFRYQPGKSLQVLATFVMQPQGGVNQRVGYNDDQNGIFLEHDGATAKIVRRTFTSGSAVDNAVDQAAWNIDPMDGSGPSGVTLDWTKAQILFMDFEWLGVGRVRVGFVVDGAVYYAHQFLNANSLDVVYMTTANLPVTYEIENSATASAAATLEQICSSVVSEGGFNPQGFIRAAGMQSFKAVSSATFTTLVSIRLKSAYTKAQLWPQSVEVLGKTANGFLYWEARVRTTPGTASFSAASAAVEFDTQSDTLSAEGDLIASGYLSPTTESGSALFNEDIPLTANEAGTADVLTIRAKSVEGVVSAAASVAWREIW